MVDLLLVEDHPILRMGLKMVIEQILDARVTAEAGNGQEGADLASRQLFDLVVMDVKMPVMDGLQAAKMIKQKNPNIKVLFYSADEDSQMIAAAINAGADGYLFKSDNPAELKTAIEAIMKNENYFNQRVSKSLLPFLMEKKTEVTDANDYVQLSVREKEILQLLLEGHSNKKIAEKLFLSIRTVSTHRYNLMKKLGCSNVVQLFKCAIEKKLVPAAKVVMPTQPW